MEFNLLQSQEKAQCCQNDVFVREKGWQVKNTHSVHTSFSVPSSPIANKHRECSERKNKLLNRIRSQLINIKTEVFKITKHHETPTKQIDQLGKSYHNQLLNSQNNFCNIIQSSQLNLNQDQNLIEIPNTHYFFLKSKLKQSQQKHKQQIVQLSEALLNLQRQLLEKDRKLQEYEEQIHHELQKFREEVVSYKNEQTLAKHIHSLQFTVEDMNQQICYLKKRIDDDVLQIKKLTIENYQLMNQKQEDKLKDDIKQNECKKVNILTHTKQPSQQSLDSFGIDEFLKLKDYNKQMSQEIILQRNTIRLLQSELAKTLKQSKNISTVQDQQLKDIKTTYEKLLDSVKQGLAQCYQSQIQDLRAQLSKYTEIQNIDLQNISKNITIIPLQKRKSKVVTETISEIIIIEQDQQFEVTSRKATTPKSQMISFSNTDRENFQKRIQQLQQIIEGLEQQIEQLKTNLQYSLVQSSNQLGSAILNNNLVSKLNLNSQQKQKLFYQSIIKQYTANLQQFLISSLFKEQLTNKQSLESISAQMQFVIEKLKIKNYELQKKFAMTEEILQNKNKLIDGLRRELLQIRHNQSDQIQRSKRISIKIYSLQKENIRLQSFYNIQKQRSEIKLQKANQQIQQLKSYKIQLQKEITKRQQRIRILKQQLTEIIKQQDKKRKNMKLFSYSNNLTKENGNQPHQIQSTYFNKIIEDLIFQLNELKHNNKNKNTNDTCKNQQIQQLKTKILKKDEQILKIKNKEAASRLRSDKLMYQQQLQRIDWVKNKKNVQIKLQKQIQILVKDLSLSKQTIQNLSSQIKYLRKQLLNQTPNFQSQQLNNIENIPLQSLLKQKKVVINQKNNINSLVESLNQQNKLEIKHLNKSYIGGIGNINS